MKMRMGDKPPGGKWLRRARNQAERVVGKFGGPERLVELVGVGRATVYLWLQKGLIPSRMIGELLEAADREGVPLENLDWNPKWDGDGVLKWVPGDGWMYVDDGSILVGRDV